MHKQRVITGLIAAPVLIFLVAKGGSWFFWLVGIVTILTMAEFYKIAWEFSGPAHLRFLPVLGGLSGFAMIMAAHSCNPSLILVLLFANLIVPGFLLVLFFADNPAIMEKGKTHILALVYIPIPLAMAVLMRGGQNGTAWIFLILLVIFGGDIGAFYAGRTFGKNKLAPKVSPKKTWEGAIGGIAANILVGLIHSRIFLPHLPLWGSILFFILIGATGQIGDLFESGFKRNAGIKDSGGLLPGHGGFLDRIDALLFALPPAYLYFSLYAVHSCTP